MHFEVKHTCNINAIESLFLVPPKGTKNCFEKSESSKKRVKLQCLPKGHVTWGIFFLQLAMQQRFHCKLWKQLPVNTPFLQLATKCCVASCKKSRTIHRRPRLMIRLVGDVTSALLSIWTCCVTTVCIYKGLYERKRFQNYSRMYVHFENIIDLPWCLVVFSVVISLLKPIRSHSGKLWLFLVSTTKGK